MRGLGIPKPSHTDQTLLNLSLSALFLVQGCKREPGIPKPELFLGFIYSVWSWYHLWLTDLLLE